MTDERHLALYCRLSKAVGGQVESVERQERWGRAYASTNLPHLPVVVYRDNDVSAFADDAVRPDYDRLRAAVRGGEVAAIWVVEQTRLEANRRRWVELVADLDDAGIGELHTNRDGLVRLDEVADIKHILAWHERKRARERINDTLADLATAGRPAGTTVLGYRHDRTMVVDGKPRSRLVVVPDEAAAIRWAAESVLSGWTLASVAREWIARGVKGRRGGTTWRGAEVRKSLSSPTVAGKRVYRGEIVGDGDWEPILDEVTWRRLVALFESRRNTQPQRRYLLTGGVAVCGECGATMAAGTIAGRNGKRRPRYHCHRQLSRHPDGGGGCNHVYVAAGPLEELVVSKLLARLRSAEFAARVAGSDPYAAERKRLTRALAGVDVRRRKLASRWGAGGLDDDEWDAARASLVADRSRLNAELAALPVVATGLDPARIAEAWPYMTFDEQRHTLRLYVSRVVVASASRSGSFDPSRVTVYDRDGEVL